MNENHSSDQNSESSDAENVVVKEKKDNHNIIVSALLRIESNIIKLLNDCEMKFHKTSFIREFWLLLMKYYLLSCDC